VKQFALCCMCVGSLWLCVVGIKCGVSVHQVCLCCVFVLVICGCE